MIELGAYTQVIAYIFEISVINDYQNFYNYGNYNKIFTVRYSHELKIHIVILLNSDGVKVLQFEIKHSSIAGLIDKGQKYQYPDYSYHGVAYYYTLFKSRIQLPVCFGTMIYNPNTGICYRNQDNPMVGCVLIDPSNSSHCKLCKRGMVLDNHNFECLEKSFRNCGSGCAFCDSNECLICDKDFLPQ